MKSWEMKHCFSPGSPETSEGYELLFTAQYKHCRAWTRVWELLIQGVWKQRIQVNMSETLLLSVRSHVNDNTTMIKLQKQLADRSDAVTELEGRFLQLQEVRCFYSPPPPNTTISSLLADLHWSLWGEQTSPAVFLLHLRKDAAWFSHSVSEHFVFTRREQKTSWTFLHRLSSHLKDTNCPLCVSTVIDTDHRNVTGKHVQYISIIRHFSLTEAFFWHELKSVAPDVSTEYLRTKRRCDLKQRTPTSTSLFALPQYTI